MDEGANEYDNPGRWIKDFIENRQPAEITVAFAGLKKDLEQEGYPVKAVVPMMSLQGEWAIKELAGRKRGYGDVDWAVIIDCDPSEKEKVVRGIHDHGEKYFTERGFNPCPGINPMNYTLNLQELDLLAQGLPEASQKYLKGENESSRTIVLASLPYLSGNAELITRFEENVKGSVSDSDWKTIREAIEKCEDWMQSVKPGKSGIDDRTRESLNLVRRLPHEITRLPEKEKTVEKSYGLIAIKPTGMNNEISEVVDYVLNLQEGNQEDEVLQQLISGMSKEETKFFLDNIGQMRLRVGRFGDMTSGNSFWQEIYEKRLGQKFWYRDLIDEVNRGTTNIFIVESDLSQNDLERWLDLFKGKENITRTTPNGEATVLKQGKGIRGMSDSEAVMVTREMLADVDKSYADSIGPEGILFADLPKNVSPMVWEKLREEERKTMLGNYVHMTGKTDEVWEGVKNILQRETGDSLIKRINQSDLPPDVKTQILIDIYCFAKEAKIDKSAETKRLYPVDEEKDREKYSFGMFVVKPTGMSGDFPDLLKYLFDPRVRSDPNFGEVVSALEQTFEPSYREEFRNILDQTVLETSFYGAYEPGEAPSFWEANYLKKNGEGFYYQAIMDEFRGGQTVETYLVRSAVPQERLDEWIKKVKGRETLISTDTKTGQEETLYKGYGIRGMVDIEAIMLTESKKQELFGKIAEKETRDKLEQLLKDIQLPVIFSRLPYQVQEILWSGLASEEQQAMISNYVHSPDDLNTVYGGVIELAKKELTEVEIEQITGKGDQNNVVIFDLVTAILQKRVDKLSGDTVTKAKLNYPGNTRAIMSEIELDLNQ